MIGVVGIVAVLAAAFYFFVYPKIKSQKQKAGEKPSEYVAVYLLNAQAYFGKIKSEDDKYLTLEEVFFVSKTPKPKKTTGEEATQSAESNFSITPLKRDPTGPVGEIKISRDNIVTIQPLREDSIVVQRIKSYLEIVNKTTN